MGFFLGGAHGLRPSTLLMYFPNSTHYLSELTKANADKVFCLGTKHIDMAGI